MTGSPEDRIETFRQDLNELCEAHGLVLVATTEIEESGIGTWEVGAIDVFDAETKQRLGQLLKHGLNG